MAKSFCSGCRFWEIAERFDLSKFHYCSKLVTDSYKVRKNICGGKYYSKDRDNKSG